MALLYKRLTAPSSSSPSHLSPQYIGAVVIFVHESRYQRHPKCPAEFQLRRFSLLRPHAFFNFKLRFTAIYSSGTSLHCAANPLAGFDSREGKSIASFFSIILRASSSDRKKKKRKEKNDEKENKKECSAGSESNAQRHIRCTQHGLSPSISIAKLILPRGGRGE